MYGGSQLSPAVRRFGTTGSMLHVMAATGACAWREACRGCVRATRSAGRAGRLGRTVRPCMGVVDGQRPAMVLARVCPVCGIDWRRFSSRLEPMRVAASASADCLSVCPRSAPKRAVSLRPACCERRRPASRVRARRLCGRCRRPPTLTDARSRSACPAARLMSLASRHAAGMSWLVVLDANRLRVKRPAGAMRATSPATR